MAGIESTRLKAAKEKNDYNQGWETTVIGAPAKAPGCCCLSIICSPCASFQLRKRALHNDLSRYECCAGICPCSGKMGESSCPALCLGCEVCCCFSPSVASTRFLIQDEQHLGNTPTDMYMIGALVCVSQLACICRCAACLTGDDTIEQCAMCLDLLADVCFCSVCACFQTQHHVQLNRRDEQLAGSEPPPQGSTLEPPPPPRMRNP